MKGESIADNQRGSFHILARSTAGLASLEWPVGHKGRVSSGQVGGHE